jgi:hypothetical protein
MKILTIKPQIKDGKKGRVLNTRVTTAVPVIKTQMREELETIQIVSTMLITMCGCRPERRTTKSTIPPLRIIMGEFPVKMEIMSTVVTLILPVWTIVISITVMAKLLQMM